jgi:hypothetical protein
VALHFPPRIALAGGGAATPLAHSPPPSSPPFQRFYIRLVPNKPCSLTELRALGVLSWSIGAEGYEQDPQYQTIRKVRRGGTLLPTAASAT